MSSTKTNLTEFLNCFFDNITPTWKIQLITFPVCFDLSKTPLPSASTSNNLIVLWHLDDSFPRIFPAGNTRTIAIRRCPFKWLFCCGQLCQTMSMERCVELCFSSAPNQDNKNPTLRCNKLMTVNWSRFDDDYLGRNNTRTGLGWGFGVTLAMLGVWTFLWEKLKM